MRREDALARLKELVDHPDTELAHEEADCILCEMLHTLGHTDLVEEWKKIKKWYA